MGNKEIAKEIMANLKNLKDLDLAQAKQVIASLLGTLSGVVQFHPITPECTELIQSAVKRAFDEKDR